MGGRGSSSGSSNTAESKLQKEYKTIDKIVKGFLNKKFPKDKDFMVLRTEDFTKAGINPDDINYVEIEKLTMPAMVKFIRDNYIRRNKMDLDEDTVISIQYSNGKFWHSDDYRHAPLFSKISSIIVSNSGGEMFAGKVNIYNFRKEGGNEERDNHDLRVDHIYPKKDKK